MTPALWTALFAVIAALATFAGGFTATFPGRLSRARLSHLIAFGAGFILSAALVSLLPESLRLVDNAPLFVLAGYVLAHLFEHTFTSHFHFGEETHPEHVVDPAVGMTALVGLGLHSFFDGVAIASGFLVTPSLGLVIALVVILHKVPEGVTIASLMVASGRSLTSARQAAGLLAVSTLAGAALMAFMGEGVKGAGLALSCGIALYVAATDLIPEFNQEGERIYSLSALAGLVLYFGVHLVIRHLGVH
jgi:ZIP family zinc transporter/zinc and cadmium transporter